VTSLDDASGSDAALRLVTALPTPTLLVDADSTVLAASDSWRALLAEAEVPAARMWLPGADLLRSLRRSVRLFPEFGDVADALRQALVDPHVATVELAIQFPAGPRWFIVATRRLPEEPAVLVSMTDITRRRAAEAQLAHQATHDALTGLPNRSVLVERLRHVGAGSRAGDALGVAAYFLDLDDFKAVNDTLGHAAGDEVLREVARRLRDAVRHEDLVARLGGDEFVVVAGRLVGEIEALAYADRLLEALTGEIVVDGHPLIVGASIGIALAEPGDPVDEALLRNADIAMLKAKTDRSGHRLFDELLDSSRRQHHDAVQALRDAIESGAVGPWFQPVVALSTGEVVSAEALTRWVHPDGHVVPPAQFLPLALRTGLIGPLDFSVLRATARALTAGPLADVPGCALNTSPQQVTSGLVVNEVRDVLAATGLAASRLTIEVTETTVLSDPRAASAHLRALRDMGVHVALDDFGTGFSSLSHLVELPIDVVKVDRSFVGRLLTDARTREICRAVVGLGTALGVSVVAEGVETPEQRDALLDMGCPLAQGFLFGRAMPADEFPVRARAAALGLR
jgi:diguanylate cyclase (GGDEF)-like protein